MGDVTSLVLDDRIRVLGDIGTLQSDLNGISFGLNGAKTNLSFGMYGFPNERKIKIKPGVIDLNLNEESSRLIGQLLACGEVQLNDSLETIAKAVNDSYRYDITGAVKKVKDKAHAMRFFFSDTGQYDKLSPNPLSYARQFAKSAREYTPKGTESLIGYCKHAGDDIRNTLQILLSDSALAMAKLGSPILRVVGHDSTLVFDLDTRNWLLINSKSSTRHYNSVPYERLPEFIEVFTNARG